MRPDKLFVFEDAEAATQALLSPLSALFRAEPSLVLGLASGASMQLLYDELSQAHCQGEFSMAQMTALVLDEFVGVTAPHSLAHWIEQQFLRKVDIRRSAVFSLDACARDLEHECRRYEHEINRLGGIDLQFLGIGSNGHIGFNEPGTAFARHTHLARLAESTRQQHLANFGGLSRTPTHALTMGLGNIAAAKRILLLAFGAHKANAIAAALSKPPDTDCPASVLQKCPQAVLVLDRDAASQLQGINVGQGMPQRLWEET